MRRFGITQPTQPTDRISSLALGSICTAIRRIECNHEQAEEETRRGVLGDRTGGRTPSLPPVSGTGGRRVYKALAKISCSQCDVARCQKCNQTNTEASGGLV